MIPANSFQKLYSLMSYNTHDVWAIVRERFMQICQTKLLHQKFHVNLKNHCCVCAIHNNLSMAHSQQIVVNVPCSTLLWMGHTQQSFDCCECPIHNNVEYGTFSTIVVHVTFTTNCWEWDIHNNHLIVVYVPFTTIWVCPILNKLLWMGHSQIVVPGGGQHWANGE